MLQFKAKTITVKVPEDDVDTEATVILAGPHFNMTFKCDPEDAPRAGDTVEIEVIV